MSLNRRQFLKTSAFSAAALGLSQFPAPSIALAADANSKLRVGVVGISGRGAGNISELLGGSEKIAELAAICDVDDNNLEAQGKKYPNAKRFFDFRTMLDEMDDLDAVLVSTPDHTHAVAAMAAMKKGLPCFCEKPLAHDVAEIRAMQKIAKEKKLATQMGTVIHATENYRRVVELIQAGAIGEVTECHVWCFKGWGGYPEPSTEKIDVPKNIHWDEWLGPAHLKYPKTIHATCDTEISKMCCPLDVECKYEFELNGKTFPLTWYDGKKRPAVIDEKKLEPLSMGVIFVGKDGILEADYGTIRLYPEEKFAKYERPAKSIPKSAGHHREWLNSIIDGGKTEPLCNFEYSGRLAEAVQLGAVSLRAGKIKLEWDADKMLVTNNKAANDFIKTEYRDGWTL